jgi:hypothetical protein
MEHRELFSTGSRAKARTLLQTNDLSQREMWMRFALMWAAAAQQNSEEATSTAQATQAT